MRVPRGHIFLDCLPSHRTLIDYDAVPLVIRKSFINLARSPLHSLARVLLSVRSRVGMGIGTPSANGVDNRLRSRLVAVAEREGWALSAECTQVASAKTEVGRCP